VRPRTPRSLTPVVSSTPPPTPQPPAPHPRRRARRYVKTRAEQELMQVKEYEKQQLFITETKLFISSCGTFA
jgi:hypothetical protein